MLHLDKERRKRETSVRIQASLRQGKLKTGGMSPNTGFIQTRKVEKLRYESEYRFHSDKKS